MKRAVIVILVTVLLGGSLLVVLRRASGAPHRSRHANALEVGPPWR